MKRREGGVYKKIGEGGKDRCEGEKEKGKDTKNDTKTTST